MKKIRLAVLALTCLISSISMAQYGFQSTYSCKTQDFAGTVVKFFVDQSTVDIFLESRALSSVLSGVQLGSTGEEFDRFHRVEISIPRSACTFSPTDTNLFICRPQNVVAISSEVRANDPTFPKGLATLIHWAIISNEKISTQTADGGNFETYHLNTEGYTQVGDFKIKTTGPCLIDPHK